MKRIILAILLFVGINAVSAQPPKFTRVPFFRNNANMLNYSLEYANHILAIGSCDQGITSNLFTKAIDYDSSFIIDSSYLGQPWGLTLARQTTNRVRTINNGLYVATTKGFNLNIYLPSLVKINATGHIDSVWDYAFSQPTRFTHYDYSPDNFIYAQAEIDDDTVSVAYESSGAILKLDTNGNELWRYTYNFSAQYADIPGGVQATEDSGCVFLCYSGAWPINSQAKLVRLNKNGTLKALYNLPIPTGIWGIRLIDYDKKDGSIIVNNGPFMGQNKLWYSSLHKIDKNMQTVWETVDGHWQYKASSNDYNFLAGAGTYLKVRGGMIGIGLDYRDSLAQINNTYSAAFACFINDSGRVVWEATYNGLYHGSKKVVGGYGFTGANLTSDGGYILTGSCFDSTGQQVGFLMKIDSMGCLSADSCETRIVSSVRNNSNETPIISLYPNPAHNNVKLKLEQLNGLADVRISFHAVIGTKVFETRIEKPETEIATKDWERGIYFYRIEASEGIVKSGKLVVE